MDESDFEDNIKLTRDEIKQKIEWSDKEIGFVSREKWRRPELKEKNINLSFIMNFRLKKSCFGSYLKEYNKLCKEQDNLMNHNKFLIDEWDYVTDECIRNEWNEHNDFVEHPWLMLNDLVLYENDIGFDELKDRIFMLRLNDQQINQMDEGLKPFENLSILYLSGNFLKTVPTDCLPNSIRFLELFGNSIKNIRCLCRNHRLKLYHLGLGRNDLTNHSDLHLLPARETFQQLHTLDLSDNDITSLLAVVEPLRILVELRSLSLEGCPCWTCFHYKEVVLSHLPDLIYLDNTKILDDDRRFDDIEFDVYNGALVFTCYRIIGLPPPPKEKNVDHLYYFEIQLPLLQKFHSTYEEESSIESEVHTSISKTKKDSAENEKDSVMRKHEKDDKSVSAKKSKPPGFYDKPNEYDEKKEKYNKTFRTDRIPHAKIMIFKEPTLVVDAPVSELEAPFSDLTSLRDTFRSKVTVKFIYVQVEKTKNVKSAKKDNKTKGKKLVVSPPSKEEVILKKLTLAKFKCNLKSVNWSDDYIDYYWADTPEITTMAVPMTGSLKSIFYINKAVKEKAQKKKNNDEEHIEVLKYQLPKIFTLQIGFGLKKYERDVSLNL